MEQDSRLKRLLYRSWHRGCKETDTVLGQFAEANLGTLPAPILDSFELLLDEQDWDIWNWLTEKNSPKPEYTQLIAMLKGYTIPIS